VAGTVTWQNAVRPPAVAACIPLERLLLETDAPDLTPEPHRGGVNLPHYLLDTAARVAEIKGISLEELAHATTGNALRLLRLPGVRKP
jgi:TatD DNase family protein